MATHKLVQDGKYLPLARSRIAAMRASGLVNATQTFVVDGFTITVKIAGKEEFITILAGAGNYEFFCSDPGAFAVGGAVKNALLFKDSDPNNLLDFAMVGCGVRSKGTPLFANTLKPSPDPDARNWPIVPVPAGLFDQGEPAQTQFKTGDDRSPGTGSAWQDQKLTEYVWRYDNKDEVMLVSCLGVGLGQNFLAQRNWLGLTCLASSDQTTESTIKSWYGFASGADAFSSYNTIFAPTGKTSGLREFTDSWDIRPSMFSKNERYEAGYKRSTYANWRRAALQRKTVNGKVYYYCISADKHGGFSAYRMKDYGVYYGDIPADKVKTCKPIYPAWVTVPDEGDLAQDHWVFTFNKDGTRATSTPFERVPAYMWVGEESFDGVTIPYLIRTSIPADSGPDPQFPTTGVIWPDVSLLSGSPSAYFTVQRERVYQQINPTGAGVNAIYVGGRFHALHKGRVTTAGETGIELVPQENPADYEPAFLCKPGFIELGFKIILAEGEKNPDNFTFEVNVLQSEAWSDNKRYYIDSAYYANTPRSEAYVNVADDTLLTAEIEVAVREPDKVVGVHDAVDKNGNFKTSRVAFYALRGDPLNFAQTFNSSKANEPNCEGALLSGYKGDIEVYYTIRNRATQKVVQRFCLGHNLTWYGAFVDTVGSSVNTTSGPAHVGGIAFADLRHMNFITRSYSVGPGNFNVGPVSRGTRYPAQLWELGPRYELRVLGEKLKTISYADPSVKGYAPVSDPLVAHANIRSDYTLLPTAYTPATGTDKYAKGAPDSFLLAIQMWAQNALIDPCVTRNIATHPDGSWSCYLDTRGGGVKFNLAGSTEEVGVFDYVRFAKGGVTSHKAIFNKAFEQKRDYSDYGDPAEMGGFCTFGIWYNPTKDAS